MAGGNRNRAAIRAFSLMPAAGAGRINLELATTAGLISQTPEYAFSEGRAADIARADEKNPVTIHAIVQPLELLCNSRKTATHNSWNCFREE
ncbi:hypothetical protein J2W52_002781 [Rhizobium miluonense]|uniref:Uncharacterized protein n=1 Tax=Rhizobium miluonense TaxID=411945 RepID=A0ABU1SQA2_9HYPH|nr:hypothetical protein [Rhizobium miluonense]